MNVHSWLHMFSQPSLQRFFPSPELNGGGCGDPSGTPGSGQHYQHPWNGVFDTRGKEGRCGLFYDLPYWNFPGRVNLTLKQQQPGTLWLIVISFLAARDGYPAVRIYRCLPVWHSGVRFYHGCCPSHSGVPAQICVRAGGARNQWYTLHDIRKFLLSAEASLLSFPIFLDGKLASLINVYALQV